MTYKELEQYYDVLFELGGTRVGKCLCPICGYRHRVFLDELNIRCPVCGHKYDISRNGGNADE